MSPIVCLGAVLKIKVATPAGSRAETTVEGQSYTHGYLDELYDVFGGNTGREMLKVQKNF